MILELNLTSPEPRSGIGLRLSEAHPREYERKMECAVYSRQQARAMFERFIENSDLPELTHGEQQEI